MMMGRRLVFHYHIKLKQQLMLLLLLLLIIIIVLLMKSKSKSKMKMKDRCRFLPLIWKRAVVPSRTLKMKLTTDPPPGWEFSSLAHALPKSESDTADVEVERNEELNEVEVEDEGPPPGWETVLPQPPCAPSLQPAAAVSADLKMGNDITRNNGVEPHSVSGSTLMQGRSSPPTPPPAQPLPSLALSDEMKSKDQDPKIHQHLAQLHHLLGAEKAQLVCGTCQKFLLYPRGAKWVQCLSCLEVKFVLEASEVGQVKCGSCLVLLMYPRGAPAVQCTSCRFVTEIGANNRRPTLSVQQAQRRGNRHRNRAR